MPHRSRFTLTVLAALLAAMGTARASGVPILKEVVITARNGALLGVADSATEGSVGAAQIATRPLLRAAELVETIPSIFCAASTWTTAATLPPACSGSRSISPPMAMARAIWT